MNTNTTPSFGQTQPIYPPLIQLVRVTSATVPGPTGGASAGVGTGGVAPTILYVSSTQQLRTDTLSPRDREPCLVDDVNNVGLPPGYYLGRLAGSYKSLPVYEVPMLGAGGNSGGGGNNDDPPPGTAPWLLPGVSPSQLNTISASLTPTQVTDLNNLNACQLQVLLQLPVTNIQSFGNLTPTQLSNIVDGLTYTQLSQIATQIPTPQIVVISSAYPQLYQAVNQQLAPSQALSFLTNLSSQQFSTLASLTPVQLQVVAQLPTPQLQTLTNLTQAQVTKLVGQLTQTQLSSILTNLTANQLQQLTNNYIANQISQLLQSNVTIAQLANIVTLPSSQNTYLFGLTTPQLQTFVQLSLSQMQTLFANLTVIQVATLVGQLTLTQLMNILTNFTIAQIQTLTSVFTSNQIQQLLQNVSVSQVGTLLTNLTSSQLQTLTQYPPPTIGILVDILSITDLKTFLNTVTTVPSPIIGDQSFFPNITNIVGKPSSTPLPLIPGYVPVVTDTSGNIWLYSGGTWINPISGGGGPATTFLGGTQGTPGALPSGVLQDPTNTASGIPTTAGSYVGQTIYNSADNLDYAWNGSNWLVKNKAPLTRVILGNQTTVSAGTLTIPSVTLNAGDLLVVEFGGSQANSDPSGGITWNGNSLTCVGGGGGVVIVNVGRSSRWYYVSSGTATGSIIATLTASWGAIVAYKIVGSTGQIDSNSSNAPGSTAQPTLNYNNPVANPSLTVISALLEGDSSSVIAGTFPTPYINGNQTVTFTDGSGNHFALQVAWQVPPMASVQFNFTMSGCTNSLFGTYLSTWY